ncbi:hypothetical protein NBRC10512_000328 [Rhodotorula toruloides]
MASSDTCSSAPNSLPSTPPALASPPTSLFPPVPLGIASLSLGSCKSHSLASKIRAAAEQGFANIELFDLDWQDFRDRFARENGYAVPCKEGDEASRAAAREVVRLCRDAGVEISCWQPLRTFEGWLDEEDEREAREYARGILDILPLLGTDLVLCCSTTAPASRTTSSLDKAVSDLRWLADLAASYSPPIRIMYEGLSFGTHRRSWQDVWQVVERADRPNLGICLDSFNTLALEWASPYTRSGRLSDDVDDKLEKNMRELVRRVPGDKIFLYQIADARLMSPPLSPPSDPSIPPIRPWSRSHRLFPLEHSLGAYLPVQRFSDAVLATGYKGTWSAEVFNDSLSAKGEEVPREHARRAMRGLERAVKEAYERAGKICRSLASSSPLDVDESARGAINDVCKFRKVARD